MPTAQLKAGDLAELEIHSIAFGGKGVGRADGMVVFVPFTSAGDKITAKITSVKSNFAEGEIYQLLYPGPDRETPPCPYYEKCGGCQYQHLSYEEELRVKSSQIRETFQRLAKMLDIPLEPMIPSPQPYGYRNRISVHAEDNKIGFRGVDPQQLIDIKKCLIATDEVNQRLTELRAKEPKEGHFSLRHPGLPPSGFYQANHLLLAKFQEMVPAKFSKKMETIIDAYCGAGFFTGKLLDLFPSVVAIEKDPRLVRDLQDLPQEKLQIVPGDVADTLTTALKKSTSQKTGLLVDPPREGLAKDVLEMIVHDPVAELVYVSCDPAALARDSKKLIEKYELVSIQPIDLFPRTAQIECVSFWKSIPV